MVLYSEKSWSSLILVPAAGEASSHSDSESRVYLSGGSDICRYIFYYKGSFLIERPVTQKWLVMEQFGYSIGIQQCQVCKDHVTFLQGGN
jgi:hypothetical protein